VAVIDTAAGSVVDTIDVGLVPIAVAVAPDGGRVYAGNGADRRVSAIDTADGSVVSTIEGDGLPTGIAITPDGSRVYVSGNVNGDGTVSVIDAADLSLEATILVGSDPRSPAFTPDGRYAYVPDPVSDSVSVIDTATNSVVATIAVGDGPVEVAVTPDGAKAYVTNYEDHNLSVVDTGSNAVVGEVYLGGSPVALAVTPDGSRVAVVNRTSTVTLIDTTTDVVEETLAIDGSVSVTEFAITPNQPPAPALSAPAIAYAGVPVTFDATASTDDVDTEKLSFRFDFGDGSSANSADGTRSHTYTEPGTYEATVTVDDGEGCAPLPEFAELGLASPFTGRTAHCNGPSAVTSEPLTVTVEELPDLGLRVSHDAPQASLRRVRVEATCKRVDCDARAFGRVRVKRPGAKPKSFKLNPDKRSLTADEPAAMAPTLPAAARRAARKALRRGGKVRAKVRVIAHGPGDQRRVRVRQVRIVG
jgi:YVTN family beta-propeller protein